MGGFLLINQYTTDAVKYIIIHTCTYQNS
jgi:hypothetical protein